MSLDETLRAERRKTIQLKFIERLPQRIASLRGDLDRMRSGCGDATTRERLLHQAHSLAGTAGTFGYTALGQTALQLERRLRALFADDCTDAASAAQMGSLIEAVEQLAESAPPESSAISLEPDLPRAQARSGTVFIVDDDIDLGREIAERLQPFGYSAEAFASTDSAAAALALHLPTALLMDVHLERGPLSGPRFAADNALLRLHQIPLLFISVQDGWDARLAALRAGGAAYIKKPIDFAALAETLDRLTGRQEHEPYRVLIVDDVEELAEHYAQVLREAGMNARALSQTAILLDTLQEFAPELVLMDLHMPECSGIEAAGVIRQKSCYDGLPIIFLSTENRAEEQLEALRAGGDEFLEKPIRDSDLVASVAIRADRFRALNALMIRDGLTGLYNQITLKLRLEEMLNLALRRSRPLSFAMIDIDHFKAVNDRYGHPTGDRVIRSIARLLRERLRRGDVVGRFGGEEFAVVMPETAVAQAVSVLDGLRAEFAALPQQNQEQEFFVSFSSGVAEAAEQRSVEGLIAAADQALYQAKRGGRNRVQAAVDSNPDSP